MKLTLWVELYKKALKWLAFTYKNKGTSKWDNDFNYKLVYNVIG